MSADKQRLNELLRQLPQVEAVLSCSELTATLAEFRHDVVKRLVRGELDREREDLTTGRSSEPRIASGVAAAVARRLAELGAPLLIPTVNATGIVLHTNLGRAVLCPEAQRAVADVAGAYSNLELDLETGKRTRRDVTLEPLLRALTGCEAVTVVNNNSAAVFLILSALAQGREVITSRGELVEIGGSYRVPDVVRASGCHLVEVGTTNRTRLADYEAAITEQTALILKTHTSNYRVIGFTEEAELEGLVELGRRHGVPVFVDLGSGYLAPEHGARLSELEVLDTLSAGPDLVSFSGDKLLGGPQAGIVLGRSELVLRLRKSPLWRVLRIDKFTVAALGATIAQQLRSRGGAPELTQRAHLASDLAGQRRTARRLTRLLRQAQPNWDFQVTEGTGFYGGGSLPEESVPAILVSVDAKGLGADELDEQLRHGRPPVVGYASGGVYTLNVLTLLKGDVEAIARRFGEL